jgi:type II secretory pathway pseudopilin PulG
MASDRPGRQRHALRAQAGFTYVALLIALAIVGMMAATSLQLGALMQRRAAEEALLVAGADFSAALDSYAKATPAGQPTAPASLNELLKDPRYPGVRRHLRKLWFDPLTGTQTWGLVMTPDGNGVLGVYSLATARPIKVGNFPPRFQAFDGKASYGEWVFMAPPPNAPAPFVPAGGSTAPNR